LGIIKDYSKDSGKKRASSFGSLHICIVKDHDRVSGQFSMSLGIPFAGKPGL